MNEKSYIKIGGEIARGDDAHKYRSEKEKKKMDYDKTEKIQKVKTLIKIQEEKANELLGGGENKKSEDPIPITGTNSESVDVTSTEIKIDNNVSNDIQMGSTEPLDKKNSLSFRNMKGKGLTMKLFSEKPFEVYIDKEKSLIEQVEQYFNDNLLTN